jgi:hypothetical protein
MKHLKLFDGFLIQESNSGDQPKFQFFPFDDQKVSESRYGLKDEISFDDLKSLEGQPIPDESWIPEGSESCGIYIAHIKTPDGKIVRFVVRSLNPLKFDVAFFDSSYKKLNDIDGVGKQSMGEVMKKTEGLNLSSQIRSAFPELYNYLTSGKKRGELAADLGDLFY